MMERTRAPSKSHTASRARLMDKETTTARGEDAGREVGDAAAEDHRTQPRFAEAHRVIHAESETAVDIPT